VAHDIVSPYTVTITQKELEEILVRTRLHVAHGERAVLDDVERLPDVEEGDAAGEQVFYFFSQELSDAHRSRFSCVIAVHEHDWSAL
jgi:hypothetical protein